MDKDERIARSQNVMYVIPHDWASIGQFLEPLLERVDDAVSDLQLLVVTSDAELAAAVSAAAVKLLDRRMVHVLGATSARRAARLIRSRPPHVVAGTAEVVVELLHGAAIKLDTIRSVCIAWADELASGGRAALETLMAELPKDAARTIVASEVTPWIDELVERYARRARRVGSTAGDAEQPIPVDYFTVAAQSRLAALRRLLDETDPPSAFVFVREPDAEGEVRDLLLSLGYGEGAESAIRVGMTAPAETELALLYDLPSTRDELGEATAGASRVIALVQPRQVSSLRSLAGGAVRPFTLPEAGQRARDRELRSREEVRRALAEGQFGRELIALEPLLDEYDGIEIAAATLQLLERERAQRAAAVPLAPAAGREARDRTREREPRERIRERVPRGATGEAGRMVRLFLSVGTRDNVRPGDLVGAIANEGGVTSSDVGKIDIRESHSIVEVAPDVADSVIERVNGVVIRGRRAIVRRDEDRGPRTTGARGGGAGRPRPGSRAPRRGDRE